MTGISSADAIGQFSGAEEAKRFLAFSAEARRIYQTLEKPNLYVSFNAHQGRPEVLTDWMDASVIDESDPVATDPELDPFSEANKPPYSAAFITKYRAAQKAQP